MDFKPENFPIYQLLVSLNEPGVENMLRDFAKARDGGPEEKYRFALGIHGLANMPGIQEALPGLTEDIRQQTLAQSFEIFKEQGAAGHGVSALMASYCLLHGLGTPVDFKAARAWHTKAVADAEVKDNPMALQIDSQLKGSEDRQRFRLWHRFRPKPPGPGGV